ncbi:methylmalonyl-CoA mutase subunit beta [Nonlabens tegetincola]|uniref:methylmalonyl-CoA mutase subunit beta n=1 Tax=Nonlabens tegetincola TaxID=323273 RepID=UPI000CF4814C|nr:methylmalonyl-CoA mutase subunit beta [Nonlabens tegetincola]PQJ16967.1 methylmalonyl-CoA mutase [Nonlabens tegetincola]
MSKLFEEFSPVTAKEWKQKIHVDLKGADYNETLITHTAEGIDIKPFYHSDDATPIQVPTRATQTGSWYISQSIYAGDAAVANEKAKDALSRGAEGVLFIIPNNSIDIEVLFKDLPSVGIQVHPQFLDLAFLEKLQQAQPKCYVHLDIINQLASDGNWFENLKPDHEKWLAFLLQHPGYFSNITVNTILYQQAGASAVQELAYYMAHLNEYLNHLEQYDMISAFAKAEKRINIDTAIGSDYFMNIAKYRAYRLVTKSLGKAYGLELEAYITASPSLRNKSLLDYNVNMLRTTTECMSAVLGGCDTIYNLPYDAFFNKENEFGTRIARNQLLVLKDEAYFDKIHNAADGAYFIEDLTKQLAEKANNLFKEVEKAGGFVQALFDGTVQRKLKESDAKEREAIETGQRVLVGVNKYPNQDQGMQEEYELYPYVKTKPRKTLIAPIVPKRLAEDFEKQA